MQNGTQQVVADTLIPGDKIVVAISGFEAGPNGGRVIPASGTFDHNGTLLPDGRTPNPAAVGLVITGGTGQAAPQFDTVKYAALMKQERYNEAKALEQAYTTSCLNFRQAGNTSLAERLGKAALVWAERVHNIKSNGDRAGANIDPTQVSVRPTFRIGNEPTTFLVNMAPVWGQQ